MNKLMHGNEINLLAVNDVLNCVLQINQRSLVKLMFLKYELQVPRDIQIVMRTNPKIFFINF